MWTSYKKADDSRLPAAGWDPAAFVLSKCYQCCQNDLGCPVYLELGEKSNPLKPPLFPFPRVALLPVPKLVTFSVCQTLLWARHHEINYFSGYKAEVSVKNEGAQNMG